MTTTKRIILGHIEGIAGTILGPKDITGEYLVILEDNVVTYATQNEIAQAIVRDGSPQSVTEHELRVEFRNQAIREGQ